MMFLVYVSGLGNALNECKWISNALAISQLMLKPMLILILALEVRTMLILMYYFCKC